LTTYRLFSCAAGAGPKEQSLCNTLQNNLLYSDFKGGPGEAGSHTEEKGV
jgi:hypothetical protein